MKEAGDKIKAVGDKTAEVGKGLSTHVTAPIVAMGAASLSAFNEVDKGMDIIMQKTGASGKARVSNLPLRVVHSLFNQF